MPEPSALPVKLIITTPNDFGTSSFVSSTHTIVGASQLVICLKFSDIIKQQFSATQGYGLCLEGPKIWEAFLQVSILHKTYWWTDGTATGNKREQFRENLCSLCPSRECRNSLRFTAVRSTTNVQKVWHLLIIVKTIQSFMIRVYNGELSRTNIDSRWGMQTEYTFFIQCRRKKECLLTVSAQCAKLCMTSLFIFGYTKTIPRWFSSKSPSSL